MSCNHVFSVDRLYRNHAHDQSLFVGEGIRQRIVIHSVDQAEIAQILSMDYDHWPHAVISDNGIVRKIKSNVLCGYGDTDIHVVVARTSGLFLQALHYALAVLVCASYLDPTLPVSIVGPNPWPDVVGHDIADDMVAAIEADMDTVIVLPFDDTFGASLKPGEYPGDEMYCLKLLCRIVGGERMFDKEEDGGNE